MIDHSSHTPSRSEHDTELSQRHRPARSEPTVGAGLPAAADADNQQIQAQMRRGAVQAKLAISPPDDPLEREADEVADAVVQRKEACSCGGTCEECQQREQIQLKRNATHAHRESQMSASQGLTSRLGSGRALDPTTRRFFGANLNHDFGHTRIHDDAQAHESAASINARAYTSGNDVVFARDEYQPHTTEGAKLLAHELTHVVQQEGSPQSNLIQRNGSLWETPESPDSRRESECRSALNWSDGGHWLGPGSEPDCSEYGRPINMEQAVKASQAAWRAVAAQKERQHADWKTSVDSSFGRDLTSQSKSVDEERKRIDFALTGQRAAVFDAVAGGEGWLQAMLQEHGYAGPDLIQVKQRWAEAVVTAELLKTSASISGEISTDARLTGLLTIPSFYSDLDVFSKAVEQAHHAHVTNENDRLSAEYQRQREEYDKGVQNDRASWGPIGEPGERSFRAGQALSRGSPPPLPRYLSEPPPISGEIKSATERAYAADTVGEWEGVAADVRRLGSGLSTLIVATLPKDSKVRQGVEYLEQLDTRLAQLEGEHRVSFRIPAVFYPEDRTISQAGPNGEMMTAPESIAWQFYLINTGVPTRDQPARSGGEWVLIDLTSGKRFENREDASDLDSVWVQQGKLVDPPVQMFSELNTKIRFPKGRLYFTLPTGKSYVLRTTERWSVSDFFAALGLALAVVAMAAAAIATGGAATPAAIAFYAGLGAAGAGVGSTLAGMHERSEQGILTSADVDRAMIQIGLDMVSALSLGLGRIVTAPGAIARLGTRFVVLSRITQGVRVANLGGDVYQALTVTAGFVDAFQAVENQPGLSDGQRDELRGQLVRRALLTGAIMTIAIRGDIADVRAGGNLSISHVDADGALVVHHPNKAAQADADAPSPRAEGPSASATGRAAPHTETVGPAHASSQQAGSGVSIGRQTHAIGVAGRGPMRDFYFCSDLCGPIADRLKTIVDVLPRDHPFRPAIQDMLGRARRATRQLKSGKLTQEQADAVGRDLSARIGRLSNDSQHFATLMNTDPGLLTTHRYAIRQHLREALDDQIAHLSTQSAKQAANRGSSRGRDPLEPPEARSPIETDILGGFNMGNVKRPSTRAQPLRFDVGNFSHTYAEALVPGLPRGLHPEVSVTLPDGSVGRADRVRFIYDADGDRIGARVYEIKPNVDDQVAKGQIQVQGYVAGLRIEIEGALRAKGKAIPQTAPHGGPLFSGQVVTYDRDQMRAVLRALRASRRDAASLVDDQAIARQVFAAAP